MQLFVGAAGVCPYGLFGQLGPYTVRKVQQNRLVFGLERLSAKQRDPLDSCWFHEIDDFVLRFFSKLLAVIEIPCLLLKTMRAMIPTAGNEERYTAARTVFDR